MTLLQHHLLALFLIFITTLTLTNLIFWNNPRRPTNRIFALYTLSLSWWSFWEFLTQFSETHAIAVDRLRLEYFGVCFMPTLFYHGVSYLVAARKKGELLAYYALSALFTILIVVARHPVFLPDAQPVAYLPYWGQAGSLYWTFILFFAICVLRVHQILLKSFRSQPPGLRRIQLKYLLLSSAMAYTAAIPEFSLKLGIRIPLLQPYGLYSVPLYAVLIGYAIIQFRLFDIHIVIRKSLVYSLLITLLTAGYFGLVYAVERLFQTTFGYDSIWFSLIAFALMTLAFQPLKGLIQRVVDRLVFKAPQEEIARRMERLEQEAQQTEKLKAISTLAAGMAHEIKNPLTALRTFAEYVPEKHKDPEFADRLHKVLTTETQRIQGIVQDVLDFAKPKPPQMKLVDLDTLIYSTTDLLSGNLLKRHIECRIDCGHSPSADGSVADQPALRADPDQLRQVLINLIQNAADAMPNGGTLSLATRNVNSHLELTISDTGTGIPKELLPKIFDPFVTTKSDGNGLGLAMVHSIIRAHGGTIHAESQPNHGTVFTVSLPL